MLEERSSRGRTEKISLRSNSISTFVRFNNRQNTKGKNRQLLRPLGCTYRPCTYGFNRTASLVLFVRDCDAENYCRFLQQ